MDVHRVGTLRCLKGLTVRDVTPADTVFFSQGEPSGNASQSAMSNALAFRSSRPPIPSKMPSHGSLKRDVIQIEDSEDEIMADDISVQFPASSEVGESDPGELDESKVVRNACTTLYRWRYIGMPDDETALLELLGALQGPKCLRTAARDLWQIVTDEQHTVHMSLRAVRDLLGTSTEAEATELACEDPVATLVLCQRHLVQTSWQIICNFWCITCSQSAARLLATIAGLTDSEAFELAYWRAHDCDCLASAVGSLGSLQGKASAAAAISEDMFCVAADGAETHRGHIRWTKADRRLLRPRLTILDSLFNHIDKGRQTMLPLAVSRSCPIDELDSALFDTSDFDNLEGILLRKPDSWPDSCPLWCFLIFDAAPTSSVGRQIEAAHANNAIWAGSRRTSDDDRLLSEWGQALREEMGH